ncbi:MAG: SMC-Scp complex subunit ScpB [Patescibacteria group bacterium]|nr:SMC-Scp complex subunit ScpB [Patescibacteria group bacterium]
MESPASMDTAAKIEAVLFWKAEPVSIKKLAQLLEAGTDEIKAGLASLEAALKGRGLALVQTDDQAMLGTAKELSPLIEQLTKDELSRDLGKAGLETLSIILYQGPISRAEIDHIRGVNSQFILRNLLVRGLVDRVDNPQDARSFLYKTSLQLLAHLGISKPSDLPEYEQVRKDIGSFKDDQQHSDALKSDADQPPQNR